ncbi:hypothetical protein CQ009_05170 [Pseudomonas sp. MYb2]|nr:hypothetical protein CQ025_19980 [Pseudomonas sp. MYb3]PRC35911.1 hypothetical protein CQ009_05170 [Pseudomonas sp. MYb2]
MIKLYMFIYNDEVGTASQITKILDNMPSVITWRYDMPHIIYVTSYYDAHVLSSQFESKFKANGRFMFIEVTANAQGRMLNDTWFLINNKYNCEPTGK